MLRIFKQYYPIRNLFFIIGEGMQCCRRETAGFYHHLIDTNKQIDS